MGDPRESRELFVAVATGERTERVPVWFMRQAGRILPEFRALRARHSFEALCTDAARAAAVTLQPLRWFDVDAAILFSDILVPLFYMDVGLRFVEGKGPVLARPVDTPDAVDRLESVTNWEEYPYQAQALKQVRESIPQKAVIGFAGAPFTLASYLIEGSSTRRAGGRAFEENHPKAYRRLMGVVVETIVSCLKYQAEAGPDALQVFDTWAGLLPREDYARLALPHAAKVIEGLRGTGLPLIYYSRKSAGTVDLAVRTGADVLGVDQTIGLRAARERVPRDVTLQGNLDPRFLLKGANGLTSAVRRVLEEGGRGPHIFNLGEGMPPEARLDRVESVVKEVRAFRR
ncbi:MAG: uroporphyrinogen decarboxylase [Thermoplasmata archaeon]